MRMRSRSAAIVLGLALTACSGSTADTASKSSSTTTTRSSTSSTQADVRPCSEVFAEGAILGPTAFDDACLSPQGQPTYYGAAFSECTDGRKLEWNDQGWGYVGEGWHRHAKGAEPEPPVDEQTTCSG